MYHDEFPGCCGITVLTDLDDYYEEDSDGFSQPVDVNTKGMKKEVSEVSTRAVMATTIPDQKAAIKALKGAGFKVVRKFKNSNSGNMVSVWLKIKKS